MHPSCRVEACGGHNSCFAGTSRDGSYLEWRQAVSGHRPANKIAKHISIPANPTRAFRHLARRCKQRSDTKRGERRSVFQDGTDTRIAKAAPQPHMTKRLPPRSMPLSLSSSKAGSDARNRSSRRVIEEKGFSIDREGRLCVLAVSSYLTLLLPSTGLVFVLVIRN